MLRKEKASQTINAKTENLMKYIGEYTKGIKVIELPLPPFVANNTDCRKLITSNHQNSLEPVERRLTFAITKLVKVFS